MTCLGIRSLRDIVEYRWRVTLWSWDLGYHSHFPLADYVMTVHRKGRKLEANLEEYAVYTRLLLFSFLDISFFQLFLLSLFQNCLPNSNHILEEVKPWESSKYCDTIKYTVTMHLTHPCLKLSPKTLAERQLSSFYFIKLYFIGFMSEAYDCIKSHNLYKHISDSMEQCCEAIIQTLVLISEAINAIKRGTFANQIMECL